METKLLCGRKKCLDDDISQQERLSFVFHPTAQSNTRKPFSLPLFWILKKESYNFVFLSEMQFLHTLENFLPQSDTAERLVFKIREVNLSINKHLQQKKTFPMPILINMMGQFYQQHSNTSIAFFTQQVLQDHFKFYIHRGIIS